MPKERMRVVATWADDDGDRWAMRDDGVSFWWSRAAQVWSLSAGPHLPVPGCAIEPAEEPTAAGGGPAGLDLTYAEKCLLFKALGALEIADRYEANNRGDLHDRLRREWFS